MLDRLFPINRPLSPGHYWHFKVVEAFLVAWTIHYIWDWGVYSARLADVVLPLGLAVYIDVSMFFGTGFMIFYAMLTTVLLLVALFTRIRAVPYAIATLLFHMQYVIRFSQGEIPHSMNMVGMGILSLAIAAVTFRRDMAKQAAYGFGLILFFFGLGYFTAGISKMVATGFSWVNGEHLQLWIAEKGIDALSKFGYWSPNWVQSLALDHTWIATIILTFGMMSEFAGPMFWSERLRPLIAMAAIGMHIGITLSMGIRFDAYLMQIILIGFAWHRPIGWVVARVGALRVPGEPSVQGNA